MKKTILLFSLITVLFGCKKECFSDGGTIISREISTESFNKILVGNEISLILKQGNTQKIVVETGDELIDNINIEVINNQLIIEDNNTCNIVRDYALTKVYVTAPDITIIRSNTTRLIKSDGILNYPNLTLLSEDYNNDYLNIGDFDLNINCDTFSVAANGNSIFNIKGTCNTATIGFYGSSPRFNGADFISQQVTIIQKSTNDMLVNPQNELSGTIYTTGNVISYNHPSIVNLNELYTGHLIYY